ncbi:hypothetical protein B5M09_000080 [Aphanomyces astaci]|uniref:Nucleoside diphosphate kinase-like domain-containing protein n=1 Tax=Aphanomyces astaci TaxID=112090 RepID=A0A3R7WKC4_APHAT|nr:hypothetical protein B5M09_000080 [Aphanomyces astaci]
MTEWWTDRDEALLRQCVFESAYDFDVAAITFLQRLPKQRKLLLGANAITPQVCERKYMEICRLEDGEYDEENGADQDVETESIGGLMRMSSSNDIHVLTTSDDLPVLELPLSDFDVDLLLQDIPSATVPRDSEMQWVLSYLEDPTNAVDEEVDGGGNISLSVFSGSEAECLSQLDLTFQASRDRSYRNRSVGNLLAPCILSLAKEDEGDVRSPTSVAGGDVKNRTLLASSTPSCEPNHSTTPAVESRSFPPPTPVSFPPSQTQGYSTKDGSPHLLLPPPQPSVDEADIESCDDVGSDSDSSSDIEDWNTARRQLKDRTIELAPSRSPPPPQETSSSLQLDNEPDDDTNDGNTVEDASEALERQLMKMWKRDVELQEQELLKDQPLDAVIEKAILVRAEVESLLLVQTTTPPVRDGHSPTARTDLDRRPFSGYNNPYALNERDVHDQLSETQVEGVPPLRSPQALLDHVGAQSVAATSRVRTSPPPDYSHDQVPSISRPIPVNLPSVEADIIKGMVEKGVMNTVDALSEPLYHRQLSHTSFVPTLPREYWRRLFSSNCSSDNDERPDDNDTFLSDTHVVAVHGVDSTDAVFATIVQLFCQLQHETSPCCTLLGLQYTVTWPGSVTSLQPPPQSHTGAVPVLYIALHCASTYIDAILLSPMAPFMPGNTNTMGDYVVSVPSVLASPPPQSSAAAIHPPLHPIHLFTRFPTFKVFHQHLPPHPPHHHYHADTTVVVLRDPAALVLDVLHRTRSRLDLVGLKLVFDASFEPHVVVSPQVATAACHVILALRGVDATTVVRDLLHDLPKTQVYLPHGALQAHRDVVHWFGGRIPLPNADSSSSSAQLPRAHPVYGIVVKPDQVVAVDVSMTAPGHLGRVLTAVATTGYDIVGLVQVHDEEERHPCCRVKLALVKENGANEFRLAHLQTTLADVDGDVKATMIPYLPHTFTSKIGMGQPSQATLTPELDAVREVLTSLQSIVFGASSSVSSVPKPTTHAALVVLFRQHVEDGHFRTHFRGMGTNAPNGLVRLYTDPTIVRSLLPLLFDPHEITTTRYASPLDACFPPSPHTDDAGLFQLVPSAPFASLLMLKPDDPLGVLPVVLRRLRREGFDLVCMHMTRLPSSSFVGHPYIVCVVRRVSCISRLQALVGPADPDEARQHARFSLVAGYGVDLVRNGFYTPPTYDQARRDLHSVYGVGTDADYDGLSRWSPSAAVVVGAPFSRSTSPQPHPAEYVTTPRTLVETTLLVAGGSAVPEASAMVASLTSDGGFLVVNLFQGGLTLHQKLHCASHFAPDVLEGPWLVLALERDNAVSRLVSYLTTSPLFADAPEKRQLCRCSTSAKEAREDLSLFFDELHGSVHSLQAVPRGEGRVISPISD